MSNYISNLKKVLKEENSEESIRVLNAIEEQQKEELVKKVVNYSAKASLFLFCFSLFTFLASTVDTALSLKLDPMLLLASGLLVSILVMISFLNCNK